MPLFTIQRRAIGVFGASVSYEPRTLLTYAQNLEDAAWWCNENDAHLLVIQSVAELNQVIAQTSAVNE